MPHPAMSLEGASHNFKLLSPSSGHCPACVESSAWDVMSWGLAGGLSGRSLVVDPGQSILYMAQLGIINCFVLAFLLVEKLFC